jgi:hypothetical protein
MKRTTALLGIIFVGFSVLFGVSCTGAVGKDARGDGFRARAGMIKESVRVWK